MCTRGRSARTWVACEETQKFFELMAVLSQQAVQEGRAQSLSIGKCRSSTELSQLLVRDPEEGKCSSLQGRTKSFISLENLSEEEQAARRADNAQQAMLRELQFRREHDSVGPQVAAGRGGRQLDRNFANSSEIYWSWWWPGTPLSTRAPTSPEIIRALRQETRDKE